MKYSVTHDTHFRYNLPVISAQQVLRLQPRELAGQQRVHRHRIELTASNAEIDDHTDYFGNTLHEVRLHAKHDGLGIHSECEVEVTPRDDILLDLSPPWEQVAGLLRVPQTEAHWEASQFCFPSPLVTHDAARDFASQLAQPGLPLLRLANTVTHTIFTEFSYQGGVTHVATEVADVLRNRMGVCQDFAHVALATFRVLGLAARYVSGYILSRGDNEPGLIGSEASHAWIAVYCPEFGWVDFDPTNNQMTSDQHITVGWGRDYNDVAPTRGSLLGGGIQTLDVEVRVRPRN